MSSKPEAIQVMICDDHEVLRRGIREILCEAPDLHVVADVGSFADLKDRLEAKTCDVLILDLNLPTQGGFEILTWMKTRYPSVRVLVHSMYPEDQYAVHCLRAGAKAYLNKAGNPYDLITAVRSVMQIRP